MPLSQRDLAFAFGQHTRTTTRKIGPGERVPWIKQLPSILPTLLPSWHLQERSLSRVWSKSWAPVGTERKRNGKRKRKGKVKGKGERKRKEEGKGKGNVGFSEETVH